MTLPSFTIQEKVKAEWVDLCEGFNGDYDDNNPNDKKLLRFNVYVWENGEWVDPGDASYCTIMPEETQEIILEMVIERIAKDCLAAIENGGSIKNILAMWSWVDENVDLNNQFIL